MKPLGSYTTWDRAAHVDRVGGVEEPSVASARPQRDRSGMSSRAPG